MTSGTIGKTGGCMGAHLGPTGGCRVHVVVHRVEGWSTWEEARARSAAGRGCESLHGALVAIGAELSSGSLRGT